MQPFVSMARAFEESNRSLVAESEAAPPSPARLALTASGVVGVGVASFDAIQAHDIAWHSAMFEGAIPFDLAEKAGIIEEYRAWLARAIELLGLLGRSAIGPPIDVTALLARVQEAKGLVTPDDEFFEGERLDVLVDRAVDALERGEAVEFREMGE